MEPIRTVDDIEHPAQGDWAILRHRSGSRAARTECHAAGSLFVGARPQDLRLYLSIETMEDTSTIDACVERADSCGHWLFSGTATRDRAQRSVELPASTTACFAATVTRRCG